MLFPIIEESEKLDVQAATQEYKRLGAGIFKDVPIGLIHGRLSRDERDRVMTNFYSGKINILVATSVIEVGVDNPNVTFMVIENAERFGLSQLHQMRGRIGRGTKESMCFLFGDPTTDDGKRRLRVLTKTTDGFKIAEEDLAIRGPGDFFGTRQSGLSFFRLADLSKDTETLLLARGEAIELLDSDHKLLAPDHRQLALEIKARKAKVNLE
jgi:ATP-dependent DNA helicase RecG